jgi:hypothetical protein
MIGSTGQFAARECGAAMIGVSPGIGNRQPNK